MAEKSILVEVGFSDFQIYFIQYPKSRNKIAASAVRFALSVHVKVNQAQRT
jgi:hypothetical protein